MNSIYNIKDSLVSKCKNAAYSIKNNATKIIPFALLVFTPMFKSCDKPDGAQHYAPAREYIMLDLGNMQMFRDEATREIVNKRNNGVVLYKLTESSKDAALNEITVGQWNEDIVPVLRDLNELAEKQINDVRFKAQDTIFVRKFFDGAKELDSIGMSNGNDLNILKYAGFKVIALNR